MNTPGRADAAVFGVLLVAVATAAAREARIEQALGIAPRDRT